jgi:ATP-dependent RNA helicase DDX10/DBP4
MVQSGAVRTKYDRMFERKNQNVLSAHYSKLIEGDGDDDDEEEFITLKRADHELDGGEVGVDEAADMSKRKQRLMASKAKRALLTGGLGKKLIFDEDGEPHEMYE